MLQNTLSDLFKQFEQVIGCYQEFWDVMSDIDKTTWVLEPDNPTYSAIHRRIAIGMYMCTNCSIQITVDPKHPRMLPECRFLGADHAVDPLKKNMNSNLHLWILENSLLDNLQLLLGVTFPSQDNSKKEEFSGECGICYSYRLESEIPDEACNDTRCGQPFHRSCLFEWLRALPSSRQSFNIIFGECPYCSKRHKT
ncbi:hypothetical protein KUTeg_014469 [Tegillarca granosa]|uniref:RING-type domain-containing protein n=1 Tax=Tegillarca granosa TaxID=220873 RepID=A0ABQ9F0E2_TEGGR|nr:hypothetical protein KUTeg_014469 [Tegillarca granosa]